MFIFGQLKKEAVKMENYIVSARKYRPDSFRTVVAQSSITTTLKNAIQNNQLAHAYLFYGPRGVGKTTCARIFAKTINCENLTADTEACNVCESCKAFNSGRSFNIHELDAASNNSVDDIRLLIEKVRVPPQMGKYSVYIIDEVHMLSPQAFNAFLKTLEEPPKHAIFILATTEKHKIIPTILSRCQIFDFNRIGLDDIADHLEFVAQSEGVSAEREALNVIAQKADGAMRDALSIFDQVVSFSGKNVTYQDVIANLNVLDYDYYFRLVEHFLKNEVPEALMIFDDILNHGFDGHHFINGMAGHIRNLLVCKDPITVQLLEVGGEIRERYKQQATACSSEFLLDALELSNRCDTQYKDSQNKRLLVELVLMRLAQLTAKKKIADEPEDLLQPIFSVPSAGAEKKPAPAPKKEVTEKVSEPARAVRRLPEQEKAPSIKDALSGKVNEKQLTSKEQHEIYTNFTEAQEFSAEELKAKWEEYVSRLNEFPNLQSTLSRIPHIEENYQLVVDIENSVQEDLINSIKPELVSWLRKELKNSQIQLDTRITEIEKERIIYSPTEKYMELLKKNPKLELLKQRFRLDFE